MLYQLAVSSADQTLVQSSNVLKQISDGLFTNNSILVLIISLVVGSVIGKLISIVLRRVSKAFGHRADQSSDLATVNRYRRLETWTILSVAIARTLCIVLAIYFWWSFTHPANKPSAVIGASALLIVLIGGVVGPLLRDFAFGGGMMAEHWFGVGDLITVEPFADMRGVVERITLRSTRIRGLNGEIIWVTNQNIQAVRIAQKGVWTLAIEMFVSDPHRAERIVEQTNHLLPIGPSLLASPLKIIAVEERSKDLWHMTVVGETAPGRNWLLEKTAIDLMKNLDEKNKTPIFITDPVARFADNDTERQFARAVKNARKTRTPKRTKLPTPKKLK